MIESESVVTADIVKKLKGNFLKVFPSSTARRLERFFNNPKFDVYEFYDEIIREVIKNYSYRFGSIESMFKNQKTNGFRLESTKMRNAQSFKTMFGLVCVALLWF